MAKERAELLNENDPIGSFLQEYIEKTDDVNDKIKAQDLFTAFVKFNRGGKMKFERAVFYQIIKNKHYEFKDFHHQKFLRYVKPKKDLNIPPPAPNPNEIEFIGDDEE